MFFVVAVIKLLPHILEVHFDGFFFCQLHECLSSFHEISSMKMVIIKRGILYLSIIVKGQYILNTCSFALRGSILNGGPGGPREVGNMSTNICILP